MIKIIKKSEINKTTKYRFYGVRCNCCNGTNNINILEIKADGSNSGTIIPICDKCLQELKKKIEDLEVENVEV